VRKREGSEREGGEERERQKTRSSLNPLVIHCIILVVHHQYFLFRIATAT
jgi:hypothetical protein